MIVALAGGVGAAKLLLGLIQVVPQKDLTVIVNTGDDIVLHGLHISPDIDIILYTLSGIVDEEKGWGIRGDAFDCLGMLGRYGEETWFQLGDADLATHIYRTRLLREGLSLSEATSRLCRWLDLETEVLPMSNERLETRIATDEGIMHFQEYLVKRGAEPVVRGVEFAGREEAKPAPRVIESISSANGVIVCPSNPVVSIGPILAIRGIRKAVERTRAPIVGVSPIVKGAAIKGPADKLMRSLGIEVSAYGVAHLYRDFLDGFVIDNADRRLKGKIEALGVRVAVTNTIMRNLRDKVSLAQVVLGLLGSLQKEKRSQT
ncbi:MAG: 2-phospho-L-lactate transferase [Candidatus Bathyarchaeia archaeon]